MARLPIPGKDAGTWGDVLNDYLSQAHKNDGTLKELSEDVLDSSVRTKLNAAGDWTALANKPSVIAAGADQAAARAAIGAGTSSLTIGTTSSTAKAGDFQPSWADVTTKPAVIAAGASQAAALEAIGATASLRADKVITVGPGGDFVTLNAAIQAASRSVADYTFDRQRLQTGHYKCEIRQLSGFVMAEQVFVVGQDLSYITITSQDAEVPITRSALNQAYGGSAQNWRSGTFPAFC